MSAPTHLAIMDRGPTVMRVLDAVAETNTTTGTTTGRGLTTCVLYAADRRSHALPPWYARAADAGLDAATAVRRSPGGRQVLAHRPLLALLREANVDAAWIDWSVVDDPVALAAGCVRSGIDCGGVDPETLARAADPVALAAGLHPPRVGVAEGPRRRLLAVTALTGRQGGVWLLGPADVSLSRSGEPVAVESSPPGLPTRVTARARDIAGAVAASLQLVGPATILLTCDGGGSTPALVGVRPGLPVGAAALELVTGTDLVARALDIVLGEPLPPGPPAAAGHAVAVRLQARDPAGGFSPTPGQLAHVRTSVGPGLRIDTGLVVGDHLHGFDPAVADLAAWGADRAEALGRLRRSLARGTAVVKGGTTNKAFLLAVLDRDEVRTGTYDGGLIDQLLATGEHLPAHHGQALLFAATEAYDQDLAADRLMFLSTAARGRPSVPAGAGRPVELRMEGHRYAFTVYRTGPAGYRVVLGGQTADIQVERRGRYERHYTLAGQHHRAIVSAHGPVLQLELDGIPHRITRDDGGAVLSTAPALVVRVHTAPGARVAAGDPLLTLETMKMESVVTAPDEGVVDAVLVAANTQVDAGRPLVRLHPAGSPAGRPGRRIELSTLLAAPNREATPRCQQLFSSLQAHLLGYDADPATVNVVLGAQAAVCERVPADDEAMRAHEEALLDVFADLGALSRRLPDPHRPSGETPTSPQEHLRTYLTTLDPERSGVPASFLDRLQRALARYGVTNLRRTAELEDALFWMYRSFLRLDEVAPAIATILQRWLVHHDVLGPSTGPHLRELLDRVTAAADGRFATVADLAREVRFRYVDEPLLEQARATVYAEMDRELDALAADPSRDDRDERIQRIVWCHQPMRARLRDRYRDADGPMQDLLLEINVRRFYRIRDLDRVVTRQVDGLRLVETSFPHDGRTYRLVAGFGPLSQLERIATAVAGSVTVADGEELVVDLSLWRPEARMGIDELSDRLRARLEQLDWGHVPHRIDITLTSDGGSLPEQQRTQHLTFRPGDAGVVEDLRYRNLHPMLGKRLELWRLRDFALERLPSVEDVYLFHTRACDNDRDQRFFAFVEIRDLTPVRGVDGAVAGLPHLERMLLEAFDALRHAQSRRPPRDRLFGNQVIAYVRPAWDVPADAWSRLARRLASASLGLGLEKVVLRVRMPAADGGLREAEIHLENPASRGLRITVRPPADTPLASRTGYGLAVLKAERIGAPYPYELVRMLTPDVDSQSAFPPGTFQEYDLAAPDTSRLVPVDRAPGANESAIVVGVLSNVTPTVREGMRRVVLLGDPTRSLGSLAEPECRRICGALDLAEQLRIPVEWYAISSGARISMTSGTENMDWIGAVLRRIITFTQAGGECNVVVTGINVGAQPYWNGEATMLMHTKGILVMTPASAMVLTGKQALDVSGGVSAEDNLGIGGYDRVMGPNGQGQYWAPDLESACLLLLRHYAHTYVVPGERFPRRAVTHDPNDRNVRDAEHPALEGTDFTRVGDVFSSVANPERKKPFDMRAVMRAVTDADHEPLERWASWRDAENAIVWDAHVGGYPVAMLGIESRSLPRSGPAPADGPPSWTSGTLFPQSSRKIARAVNAASGNRPLVVLANLSGFDGSPESMRQWQLEYGAEIGRAVTNFDGPIVFVVVSRYHGGAFVVFSKTLNPGVEVAAVEGSYASVIGGAPAAAVVFARDVAGRTHDDARVVAARRAVEEATGAEAATRRRALERLTTQVHAEKLGEVAEEFDTIHDIDRARRVGSVDAIIPPEALRPYVIDAVERGMARTTATRDHRGRASQEWTGVAP